MNVENILVFRRIKEGLKIYYLLTFNITKMYNEASTSHHSSWFSIIILDSNMILT